MPRDFGNRPIRYWTFAAQHRGRFADILPDSVCEAAMATCRFEIRGLESNGNEWGIGFLTFMQTFGHTPLGVGLPGEPAVQAIHNFVGLTSHEGADVILECFGLTARNVLEYYGEPAFGERRIFDLFQVVRDLRPEFGLGEQQIAEVA